MNLGHFIGGQIQPATDGFPVHAPASDQLLGHAAQGTPEDVDHAVADASAAFEAWAHQAPGDRERALLRAADHLEAHGHRLRDLLIDESGSTAAKADFELAYGSTLLRTAAGEARRLYGDTFPNDRPHRMSFVVREPLGVVGVISPFNAPIALLLKMVAFPLAAGNTVVAKPSEHTPLVAVQLAALLHEGGLPAGVFDVVTGAGPTTGAALAAHPTVRGIAFTGSTATGRALGAQAGRDLKRVQLELGGKNAALVLADVDPEEAARQIAIGAFTHAGQICMSSSRVIVQRAIAEPFLAALSRIADGLHLGDLRDPATAYGPLISDAAVAKVHGQVEAALAAGASLLCGGAHTGRTYRPTVVLEPEGALWHEETFGPVIAAKIADTVDDAINAANDSAYGLSAAVLTHDLATALDAARRIRAGGVHLGMHSFQSNALAPVGGVGASGIGRSGGKYSVDHFTELKWISVELGQAPVPPAFGSAP